MDGKTERHQLGTGVLTASGDTGVQACAEPPSHGPGGSVGLQRAASAVFTDSPDRGAQTDVMCSDVAVDELDVHNSVVSAEKCVDSFLSDGWSELRLSLIHI